MPLRQLLSQLASGATPGFNPNAQMPTFDGARQPLGGDPRVDMQTLSLPDIASQKRSNPFGRGGSFWDTLGGISDAIAVSRGAPETYAPFQERRLERERELNTRNALANFLQNPNDEAGLQALILADPEKALPFIAERQKVNEPQVIQTGQGGAIGIDPRTGERIWGIDPVVKPTEATQLQRNVEYIRTLNPKLTDEQAAQIAMQGMSGYQYSPEGISAAGERENAVASARARHRAPPRASGGSGLKSMSTADLLRALGN